MLVRQANAHFELERDGSIPIPSSSSDQRKREIQASNVVVEQMFGQLIVSPPGLDLAASQLTIQTILLISTFSLISVKCHRGEELIAGKGKERKGKEMV